MEGREGGRAGRKGRREGGTMERGREGLSERRRKRGREEGGVVRCKANQCVCVCVCVCVYVCVHATLTDQVTNNH